MILQQSHKRVDIHKEESDSYESKIEEEIEILKKMRNHLNTRCTNDCNDGKSICKWQIKLVSHSQDM